MRHLVVQACLAMFGLASAGAAIAQAPATELTPMKSAVVTLSPEQLELIGASTAKKAEEPEVATIEDKKDVLKTAAAGLTGVAIVKGSNQLLIYQSVGSAEVIATQLTKMGRADLAEAWAPKLFEAAKSTPARSVVAFTMGAGGAVAATNFLGGLGFEVPGWVTAVLAVSAGLVMVYFFGKQRSA